KIGRRSQTKTPTGGHHMRSKSTSPKERAKRASASQGGRGGKEEASEASEAAGAKIGRRSQTKTPTGGHHMRSKSTSPKERAKRASANESGRGGLRRSERSERARPKVAAGG